MKRSIMTTGLIMLTAVLLLPACNITNNDSSSFSNFNHELRGTWETPQGMHYFSAATVLIDYDTITITGTGRPQPLDYFTPGSQLRGYSEETYKSLDKVEGTIYIKDKGTWQSPIHYTMWRDTANQKWLTLKSSNAFFDLTLCYQQ